MKRTIGHVMSVDVSARWRLQAVQEVNGLRRMRCGREDRPLVVFEDLQPILDVAGVVLANLRRDPQIGTEKRGAQLCDQLLEGVPFVSEALAAEVAIEP